MGDLNSRLSGLSEIGFNLNFMLPTLGLIFVLIVFFIVVKILRKAARQGKNDMMAGITYLDVTGMKKQGLLTEEEMVKVRSAMSRQVERQRTGPSIKAPASLAGELALMADPEVQQLEMLAEKKARLRAQPTPEPSYNEAHTAPPIRDHVVSETWDPIPPDFGSPPTGENQAYTLPPTPATTTPAGAGKYDELTSPAHPSAELDASAWTRPAAPNSSAADEVQLPADIIKMVELGLITPEELERIKQRIREKKQQLG